MSDWCIRCNRPTVIKPGDEAQRKRRFNFGFWNQSKYQQDRMERPCICPTPKPEWKEYWLTLINPLDGTRLWDNSND